MKEDQVKKKEQDNAPWEKDWKGETFKNGVSNQKSWQLV